MKNNIVMSLISIHMIPTVALVFTKTTNSITIPVYISALGSQYIHAFDQIAASGFVASLPPIILALIFQKFLIKGLTAGSTKG
jgi:multiple sugar transport system permease protein